METSPLTKFSYNNEKQSLPYIACIHQFLIDFLFDVKTQFELKMMCKIHYLHSPISFFAVRSPN
jgi:hypothetical protein